MVNHENRKNGVNMTEKTVDLNAISMLHEDDNLDLRFLPGRSRALVLAITGVGHKMGAEQTGEFVRSASADGDRNVLFVIDKKRSWFTQPGVVDNTCRHTRDLIDQLGCNSVSTLGNSMGGYGAILFSKFLPVSSAVAFVPQYSMNRLIVFERRWREYRKNILRAPINGLNAAIMDSTKYFVVYGDDPMDRRHQRKFKSAPNLSMFTVPHGGHNAAKYLKEKAVLTSVISSGLDGDSEGFSKILLSLDAVSTDRGR